MEGVGVVMYATNASGAATRALAHAQQRLPQLPCTRTFFMMPSPASNSSIARRRSSHVMAAVVQLEPEYIVYDPSKSVFPAEACEEVGGDACNIQGIGPEVKATTTTPINESNIPTATTIEREYLEYTEAKTVFPGEACDELGGEFCEPEYQLGVFPEKVA